MKKICVTCNKSFNAIRSQKTCSNDCKRDKYIKVYLTKKEFENIQILKDMLSIHYPTLSIQELFRLIVNNIDIAMIEYMKLENDDPIKTLLYHRAITENFA